MATGNEAHEIGGAVEKRGFVGSSPEKYSGVRVSAGSEVVGLVWVEACMLRIGILQAWGSDPFEIEAWRRTACSRGQRAVDQQRVAPRRLEACASDAA